MKKTIAMAALMAASAQSTAIAFPRPPGGEQPKYVKVCVTVIKNTDGGLFSGGCDSSANNKLKGVKILSSGCAKGQIALTFENESPIRACMPPGMVQL